MNVSRRLLFPAVILLCATAMLAGCSGGGSAVPSTGGAAQGALANPQSSAAQSFGWGGHGGNGGNGSWQQQPWWPGLPTPPQQQWGPWQQQNAGESVLYSFPTAASGQFVNSPLAFSWTGNLYGTTFGGGTNSDGVAFVLTPSRSGYQETVIYNFANANGLAGVEPGPLTMDWQGNLWGQASRGIFELKQSAPNVWNASLVFQCDTPRKPFTRQLTMSGGSIFVTCADHLWQLTPSGSGYTATALHNFNGPDGFVPNGGVVVDWQGNIFGSTRWGGAHNFGLVYELTPGPSGYTETVLHTFAAADGENPSTVILDREGAIYGTTYKGGPHNNGTVFKLVPGATGYTYQIIDDLANGANPTDVPLMDAWGSLYFTTSANAGGGGSGSLFLLTSTQSGYVESTESAFTAGADSSEAAGPAGPYGTALFSDWSGNIYGTSLAGGSGNCSGGCGTVWKYVPGFTNHGGGWGNGGWGNGWGYCGGNGNNYGNQNGWPGWNRQ